MGMQPDESKEQEGKLFSKTRWSLVAQAREPGQAQRALSELCQIYWYPVYAYIRSLGKSHHDAQDLAQGVFAYLLERGDFAKADADRGRLRTYLCVAVKRYVFRADRDRNRIKRGGAHLTLSLDAGEGERKFEREPCEHESPETYFDRNWATALIETALANLEGKYRSKGKAELFAELRPYISINASSDSQGDAAERLGMKVGTFRMAVTRVRQRYGEILRETVADTLTDPEKVEEELGHLLEVFGR